MQLPPLPETAEEPDEEEGEYVEEQLTSSYFTEESLGPAPEVILTRFADTFAENLALAVGIPSGPSRK